jgi:hypothetical protein
MKLSDYKRYFNLSYDAFIAESNIPSNRVNENVAYEKITPATRVDGADHQYFFFQSGRLKMIYISDDILAKKIWEDFNSTTNTKTPEKTVRSRAGKTSNQVIFASHGITASVVKGEVDFIELYPPCSLEHYLENIYREPQLFIR